MNDLRGLVEKWREGMRDCPCLECQIKNKCADELAEVIGRNVPDGTGEFQRGFNEAVEKAAGLVSECLHSHDIWKLAASQIRSLSIPSGPVQQPATEPDDTTQTCKRLFLQIKNRDYPWLNWMILDTQIAVIVDAMEAWAARHVPPPAATSAVFDKLVEKWEEVYDAFTMPCYKVTKRPDAMKGLRQCIEELKEAVVEAHHVPVGTEPTELERQLQVAHNVLRIELGRKCSLTADLCAVCTKVELAMALAHSPEGKT